MNKLFYDFLKKNLSNFSLATLLEFLESEKMESGIDFQSNFYLAQPPNEIESISKSENKIVIMLNNISLLNYLPQSYTELILSNSRNEKIINFINTFTRNMVYLNYSIVKLNNLPLYPRGKILSIYSNFFTLLPNAILFTNYRTSYALGELLYCHFQDEIHIKIEKCTPTKVKIGASKAVLGKKWLGITAISYNLTLITINCLTAESYLKITSGEIDYIFDLFKNSSEFRILMDDSIKTKAILGDRLLGCVTI